MRFAQIVKQNRIRLGLTQTELAQKLGVSTSSVGMWERSTRVPSDILLHKLSRLFGISIDELLGFEVPSSSGYVSPTKAELIEKIKKMDDETIAALNKIADTIISKR